MIQAKNRFSALGITALSIALLLITIFGIDDKELLEKAVPLAGAMFFPVIFMIFGGIAIDIRRSMNSKRLSEGLLL